MSAYLGPVFEREQRLARRRSRIWNLLVAGMGSSATLVVLAVVELVR